MLWFLADMLNCYTCEPEDEKCRTTVLKNCVKAVCSTLTRIEYPSGKYGVESVLVIMGCKIHFRLIAHWSIFPPICFYFIFQMYNCTIVTVCIVNDFEPLLSPSNSDSIRVSKGCTYVAENCYFMDKVTELSMNNGYSQASESLFCCNTTGCNIDTLPGKNTHLVKCTSSQLSIDGLVWEKQRLIFISLRWLLFNDMVVHLWSGQPSL